jgi:NAD(P)-dependent dehydrogenase (short-subunit alcohol dehydrogenase family)
MKTILVVGAGRGLGRGVAATLAGSGSAVISVSRTEHTPAHPDIRTEVADAADPATATRLLDRYDPDAIVLVAGSSPAMLPLHEQTWETFSTNWHGDVRIAFEWLRAALLRPLRPGARMVIFSSGAALAGSPLSGGYAGAKATQRMITGYARGEAERAGLGITFTAVLPRLTPLTDLGRAASRAYAARDGLSDEEFAKQAGDPLTPSDAGVAVASLLAMTDPAPAYLLTADGLRPLAP